MLKRLQSLKASIIENHGRSNSSKINFLILQKMFELVTVLYLKLINNIFQCFNKIRYIKLMFLLIHRYIITLIQNIYYNFKIKEIIFGKIFFFIISCNISINCYHYLYLIKI